MDTVTVEAVRAFCVDGNRVEPRELVDVSWATAVELISYGKAVRVFADPAEPAAEEAPAKPVKAKKAEAE